MLFPFALILFGLTFLRLRIFLAAPHVSIGFLVFFLSLMGLSKAGVLGLYLFQVLADLVSGIGANLVYLAGILVGIIVFFDTSIDEAIELAAAIKKNISRFFPSSLISFLKTSKS